MDGHKLDRTRKDIIQTFREFGLNITIDTNTTKADLLDVTLDLETGMYKRYRKPNEKLTYIHRTHATRL